MSGQPESGTSRNSATERLAELEQRLEEYEKRIGLPTFGLAEEVQEEATRLLKLTPKELRKMSAVECSEAAYTLQQFSNQLQEAMNREQGRVRWANENIDKMIATVVHQVPGYKYEERRAKAVRANDAASKIDEIRVQAQMRIERLNFRSAKVTDMARTLMGLSNAKQRSRDD